MTTYYTSDLHLFHTNLIDSKFRDFDNDVDMNCRIIENINSKVKADDKLYILGDVVMSGKLREQMTTFWLKKINCKDIIVIAGNHDRAKALDAWKSQHVITNWHPWKVVKDTAFGVDVNIALFHHPVIDFHSNQNASICLHGHSHGMLPYKLPFLFDVGLDVFDFKPVTLEEILSKYYGYHPNPYIECIDQTKKFMNKFDAFMKDFELEF